MNPEEKNKLKDGDIIRNTATGNAYTVLRNLGDVVIAARTIEIRNAREWEIVYTTTPVVPAAALCVPPEPISSIIERVKELDKRGWRFEDDPCARWITPDGYNYYSLEVAYKSRGCHPSKADIEAKKKVERPRPVKSFSEARVALHTAGWRNVYGKVWKTPAGCYFDGTLAAYKAMMKSLDDGTCNAS